MLRPFTIGGRFCAGWEIRIWNYFSVCTYPVNQHRTTCWRCCLLSKVYWWSLCRKPGSCRNVDLYLGSQFYFLGQCICFYVIMLFYYSVLQYNLKSGWWCLQKCFCYSGSFLAIPGLLYFHIKIIFFIIFIFWVRILLCNPGWLWSGIPLASHS